MSEHKDEIRQANRKALPKFFLMLLCATLAGGVVGFFSAFWGLEQLGSALQRGGRFFSLHVAHWGMAACAVGTLAAFLITCMPARRQLASWNGEDEECSDRIDRRLSVGMWANSLFMILAMFLLGSAYAGSGAMEEARPVPVAVTMVCFILTMAFCILFQQRAVDLSKRLNPEKQGSVYDTRFHKQWMDSCDEAEKIVIGQCAYRAYRAVSTTCLVLWLVFTFTAMFLDTGFLPVLTVCLIWGVAQSVYCRWSLKLSRPGNSLL